MYILSQNMHNVNSSFFIFREKITGSDHKSSIFPFLLPVTPMISPYRREKINVVYSILKIHLPKGGLRMRNDDYTDELDFEREIGRAHV